MELGAVTQLQVPDDLVSEIYELGQVVYPITNADANQYFVLTSELNEKKSAIVRYYNKTIYRLHNTKTQKLSGLSPKDACQVSAFDTIMDQDVLLNVMLGVAGTGKTTIAMAYAMHQFHNEKKRIVLTKPATFVGSARAFGAVPGTVQEKYAPFLDSYKIVLKKILGDNAEGFIEMMIKNKQLEFVPLEYARGTTFDDCTFIVDEAQNMTWHELNTIVSRVGSQSKALILGDLNQIDVKMRREETGLYQMCSSKAFRESPITSTLQLTHQYRSPITQLVCDVDQELRNNAEVFRTSK